MKKYSVYDTATGYFTGAVICCSSVPTYTNVIEGEYDPYAFKVVSGNAVAYVRTPPTEPDSSVAARARTQRNALLAETDWVAIMAAENGAPPSLAWRTYRTALRDLPQQIGFPHTIVWPTKPE